MISTYWSRNLDCLIDWLRRRVIQFRIVMSASYNTQREKKLSLFNIKSWVTCGTKIRHGKVGNNRIFESNWLNIESQIDSTLRVKLTQHWESNWLNGSRSFWSRSFGSGTLRSRSFGSWTLRSRSFWSWSFGSGSFWSVDSKDII